MKIMILIALISTIVMLSHLAGTRRPKPEPRPA
jgi:hypothetical protein